MYQRESVDGNNQKDRVETRKLRKTGGMTNALSSFEGAIESIIEDSMLNALHARGQPIEIAKKLAKAMETKACIWTDGRFIAPDKYTVRLQPKPYSAYVNILEVIEQDLAKYLQNASLEHRPTISFLEPPIVKLKTNPYMGRRRILVMAYWGEEDPAEEALSHAKPVEPPAENLKASIGRLSAAHYQDLAGKPVDRVQVAQDLTDLYRGLPEKTRKNDPKVAAYFQQYKPLIKDPITGRNLIDDPDILKLINSLSPELIKPKSEQFKGLKPEKVIQLVQDLAVRLQTADTSITDEIEDQERDILKERISSGKSFLGKDKNTLKDPDKLWVALHILYPEDAAKSAYAIIRQAQIVAGSNSTPRDWNNKNLKDVSKKAHEILLKNPDSLDELNNEQILVGDMAVLPLLQASMNEGTAKKEEKAAVDPELEKDKGRIIAKFAVGYPELPMVQGKAKAEDLINRWIEFHQGDTAAALRDISDLSGLSKQEPDNVQRFVSLIPKNIALQFRAIPIGIDNSNLSELCVAFEKIPSQETLGLLADITGDESIKIHPLLAYPGKVQEAIGKLYKA